MSKYKMVHQCGKCKKAYSEYWYLVRVWDNDGNEPMSLCEDADLCEVIGNIHENPELLEEEADAKD